MLSLLRNRQTETGENRDTLVTSDSRLELKWRGASVIAGDYDFSLVLDQAGTIASTHILATGERRPALVS